MPQGLQVFNKNAELFNDVTDRVTLVVKSGTFVGNANGNGTFITHAAIQPANHDQWFVAVTGGNSFKLGNGGFTVFGTGESSGTFSYTLFRW